jgi:murein DD-endopeptidase MepM/ murein hydrolase activator NlpD
MVASLNREKELVRALREMERKKQAAAAAASEREWLEQSFGLDPKEAKAVQSQIDKPAAVTAAQRVKSKAVGRVARSIEDEAVKSVADLIEIAIKLGLVTAGVLILMNFIIVGSWSKRAQESGSVGGYFLQNTLGLSIPGWLGGGGSNNKAPVGANSGDTTELKVGQSVGPYKVTSGVGPRKSPGGVGSTNHAGVDIATPTGTPIYAPTDTVVECLSSGGGGIGARFENGRGVVTLWHLSKCDGGNKSQGDSIGATGNTGSATTGPHLHLEVKVDGAIVNPQVRDVAPVLGIASAGGAINLAALREAIKSQESGGNHRAINDRTGAAGAWQILPSNIPNWSRQCLGQSVSISQFIDDLTTQQKIVECKLGEYASTHQGISNTEEMLVRRVASTWYSGNGDLYDSGRPQGPSGKEPSIRAYTVSIWEKYQGLK